jgi:hypothetical protein
MLQTTQIQHKFGRSLIFCQVYLTNNSLELFIGIHDCLNSITTQKGAVYIQV